MTDGLSKGVLDSAVAGICSSSISYSNQLKPWWWHNKAKRTTRCPTVCLNYIKCFCCWEVVWTVWTWRACTVTSTVSVIMARRKHTRHVWPVFQQFQSPSISDTSEDDSHVCCFVLSNRWYWILTSKTRGMEINKAIYFPFTNTNKIIVLIGITEPNTSFLASNVTLAPCLATSIAISLPIPLEPPVIWSQIFQQTNLSF